MFCNPNATHTNNRLPVSNWSHWTFCFCPFLGPTCPFFLVHPLQNLSNDACTRCSAWSMPNGWRVRCLWSIANTYLNWIRATMQCNCVGLMWVARSRWWWLVFYWCCWWRLSMKPPFDLFLHPLRSVDVCHWRHLQWSLGPDWLWLAHLFSLCLALPFVGPLVLVVAVVHW